MVIKSKIGGKDFYRSSKKPSATAQYWQEKAANGRKTDKRGQNAANTLKKDNI
jgi:hypothetical protein